MVLSVSPVPLPPATPEAPSTETVARAQTMLRAILDEVGRAYLGRREIPELILTALLARGHCLLEGVPGVAKTTLIKTVATAIAGTFKRIQFTPDLLPSDITGTYVLSHREGGFTLRHGPIFSHVVFGDEINRAPAKTQSALLEAMQEYQVTVDGDTIPLPRPFMVMATQNPVEQEGVYRLPEAQLDRFLLRIEMGYPGFENEVNMLKLHGRPTADVQPMFTPETILGLQSKLQYVYGKESLYRYIIELAEATRNHQDVALGASPRAALSLLRCARARAALKGRHYVTHEDVQKVSFGVLGHRIIMRPEAAIEGREVSDVVKDVLAQVKVLETG